MINKTIIGTLLLLACSLSVTAQQREKTSESGEAKSSDLNREMEVTRAYEPTVSEANKLNVKPNLIDTVKLRPEVEYRITPSPIAYGFEVSPIRPASVNIDLYRQPKPLYVKAALGCPFQSVADVYFNTTRKSKGLFGAYLNHYGSWSKIKNGNDLKTPASETFNKIGVVGQRYGSRYVLDGEVGFDYDMVTRYGYGYDPTLITLPLSFDTTASGLRQHFTTVRGRVSFGDTFADMSHFNFKIGAEVAYFSDKFDMAETGVKAGLKLGKRFGGLHEVTLQGGYEGYLGGDERSDLQNHMIHVAPLYHYKGDQFDFALGVDITYNSMTGYDPGNDFSKCYFYPRFSLRYDGTNGYFVPYIEVDGGLKSNDYRSLVSMNPYVMALPVANTSEYNGRIGIMGSFSSAFSYKVYGGLTHAQGLATFSNYYKSYVSYGNLFNVMCDTVTMWTVGADFEGRVSGAFGLEASLQYKGFSKKSYEHVSGVPNFTGRLDLRYSIRDKVILTVGATLLSSRWFALEGEPLLIGAASPVWEKINTTVDVHFGVEYRASKAVSIFVQGNNLACQKLYPYYMYRGLGGNVLAGVKLTF